MTDLIIPTSAVPAQRLKAILSAQATTLVIRQMVTGLFMDVYVSDALVIGGVACRDRNRIVRDAYLGFAGDLAWVDTQGLLDPYYTGLGARWVLVYRV